MILKDLYLYPDLVEFTDDVTGSFRDQTRCLCNYLQRECLKNLKHKADGFKRICVIGKSEPDDKVTINSSKVASIETKFNSREYKEKTEAELQEYFIALLLDGLSKFNEQVTIPISDILEKVETFRSSGYRNEWVHKSKKVKGSKLVVSLECQLTTNSFNLFFRVSNANECIFEELILTTAPDEVAFVHKFKNLINNNERFFVTDKFDDIVYEKDISEFN